MIAKFSMNNVRKSLRLYGFYFFTLASIGALFYSFNALHGQEGLLTLSANKLSLYQGLENLTDVISIIIAVIMSFIMVYANSILVREREDEFKVYYTLGMNGWQVAAMSFFETIIVSLLSLSAGLILGIFLSQFVFILVATLFDVDFIQRMIMFSPYAAIKTLLYFIVILMIVDLMQVLQIWIKKMRGESPKRAVSKTHKSSHTLLSLCGIAVSCGLLARLYTGLLHVWTTINSRFELLYYAALLISGTFLLYLSVSQLLISIKDKYPEKLFRGTRIIVYRYFLQERTKNVLNMLLLTVMLFTTVMTVYACIGFAFSTSPDIPSLMKADIDILCEERTPISEILEDNGFDMSLFKEYTDAEIYVDETFTWNDTLGEFGAEALERYPALMTESPEVIMRISDYNRIAEILENPTYPPLESGEYMIVCNYDVALDVRNTALEREAVQITINGQTYTPKYRECKDGYIFLSITPANAGIIIVPDDADLPEESYAYGFLLGKYNDAAGTDLTSIDSMFTDPDSALNVKLMEQQIVLDSSTKLLFEDTKIGIVTICTYIGVYLGISLLLISCLILSLKLFTDNVDNRKRYRVLWELGCDENTINRLLFDQTLISFCLPMGVAVIHSIFGIICLNGFFDYYVSYQIQFRSELVAIIVIASIYIIYWIVAYMESKAFIKRYKLTHRK